jgi:uncharacterized coiled-coil protein SlyX
MDQEKELSLGEVNALYAAALKRIEDLEGEAAESTEIISDLQEQLANAQAGQEISETVVVTHTAEDGTKEQYKVLAPKFQHKHVAYAAADLKTNADLVKELVAAGSGVLVKLEKPAKPAKKDASK